MSKQPVKEEPEAATLGVLMRARLWVKRHKLETLLIVLLLAVSAAAQGWGMFHYPYYENDEATYTSRAWSVVHEGRLDVYTYRYDHAPLGWIVIGAWQVVSGGAHVFGSLLNDGRVLMLLIHLLSTVLVYVLARRLSGGSKLASAVAVLFFSLSPLAIYFQRRVLLDNIMTFWLLVSLYFATQPVRRLKYYILSALLFGVAVLTKLNAIFIAPAVLYIVWIRAHNKHRLHAAAYWAVLTSMVIASFFMYALLKGELLAAPIGPGGNPTHVSVVETFALQLGRGDFAWPWMANSSFVQNIKSWALKDISFLVLGALATGVVTIVGIRRWKRQPYILALAGIVLLYVAFLARGKIVLDLYIVPLIPFLAVAIGVAAAIVHNDWLRDRWARDLFLVVIFGGVVAIYGFAASTSHYHTDETSNQIAAAAWVKQHIPKDAVIATDNYLYPYLAEEDHFKNVSYFFSTEYDPEVRRVYDNDWRNIEYLVLTHEVVKQIKTGTVPRMKQVLDHAVLLADYREDSSSYIDLPHYISTNGDWAQVYKVKSHNDIVLQDSWQHFKKYFILDYGQVVDLTNNSLTTSTSQAQAMLRAVDEGDRATFGGVWQWSKDHLRYRKFDKLLSWKWEKQPNGTYKLADSNTVCDADQQIAYALYQADEKWPGHGYGKEAKVHTDDWWRQCTFVVAGKRYMDSSADGSKGDRLVNPGYFRPAIYRYLATKQPGLPWSALINDGYDLYARLYSERHTTPNWVIVRTDGSLGTAQSLLGAGADTYGYDTMQLVPSLAEDYVISQDPRAMHALQELEPHAAAFAATTKSLPAQAALLLSRQVLYNGIGRSKELQKEYERTIFNAYHPKDGRWADGYNYRDQVWLAQWHTLQNLLPPAQQVSLK